MPTLSEYLTALTRHPGLEAERFTTGIQASPPAGSYVGVAAGADATRQLVSTDLTRLDVSGVGGAPDASLYDDAYAWIPSLGLQRRVPPNGYTPNAEADTATDQGASTEYVGVLTLTRSLGTTVAAGVAAEIHKPLPPMFDADGRPALRTWINRALATERMPYRITLTGVANAYRYSLAAYPWLRDEGDLIRVSDREYLSDQDPYTLPGQSSLRFDGASAYLIVEAPVNAGSAFYLDVYRRRDTWINTGSGYASSTTGLVSLTDQATGPLEPTALLAYYFICTYLATRSAQGTDNQWLLNAQRVAGAVAPYLAYGQPAGPKTHSASSSVYGDHPVFLARRQSGAGRRWS